jgi:LPS-assembly protein
VRRSLDLRFAYKCFHSYSTLNLKFLNVASQYRPKFSPCVLSPFALSPIARALMSLLVGAYAASGGNGNLLIHVSAQQSITPTQAELDSAIRESLKPDRSIPTPGSLKQRKKEGPKVLEADSIDGVNEKNVTAKGNVVLQQDNMTVNADRVEYDQTTDMANVPGRMRIKRDGDIITGSDLKLKIETEIGTLNDATFFLGKTPLRPNQRYEARGAAAKLDMEGPDRERLFSAFYTTCKPGEEDWYLRVSELELNRTTNVGTALNGRVEFKGVPILYLPYMSFPLDGERKSGFLPPSIGSSTASGLELSVPYYWNISPDRDATITPKIFSRRGLQLGGEFRYLNPKSVGEIDAEFLPSDRLANRDRYLGSLRHFQNLDGAFNGFFKSGWSASVNAQKVSDDDYFRDLSTRIASTSQTNLPREAALNYLSDFGNLNARFLSFQTLQDPERSVPIPYRVAPQITFNANPARINGLEFNTVGEFTDFRHPTLVNGRRWLLYPSMSLPLARPYGFVTPKIGYHLTRYDVTENVGNFESRTRGLPIASVDSGLFFERPFTFKEKSFTQTLEPRLFFLYVPFRDQTRLPVFSTSESDFNFAQIFNENLFIGGDRISDAKQVTAAVTTRFIENATGIERLRAAIGQRYYFQTQRVTLTDTVSAGSLGLPTNAQGTTSGTASRSDLLVAVSGQVSNNWFLDSGFQYSASNSQFQKSNVAARYVDGGKLLNFSYRYTRFDPVKKIDDSLKQIDISTQWPFGRIAPGWTILARANHSLKDKKLLEGLIGVEYNQGCWEFRLVAHRFTTATQQYSNSIQFQLELKGLSKLGINPLETIRQNIPGYRRSDDKLD